MKRGIGRDILMSLTGVQFADARERRVPVDFEEMPTFFISLQDLITSKQALGRPQDVIDVALLRQGLDPDKPALR
ncbi:MAG: hypothetical protein SH809_16970 [Rhodothermales bacterium]|nr:hypothetical protein [Rhodothermales bacterium]